MSLSDCSYWLQLNTLLVMPRVGSAPKRFSPSNEHWLTGDKVPLSAENEFPSGHRYILSDQSQTF
jgi:hypothetical protein